MLGLVRRVIAAGDPGSRERGAERRRIAAEERYAHGEKRGRAVSARAVREWIAAYEAKGVAGLCRKAREDRRSSRVILSRKWDALAQASGLSEEVSNAVRRHVERRVKGLFAKGQSARVIQFDVQPYVMKLSRDSGIVADDESLRRACLLPASFISQFSAFGHLHTYRADAGRSAATQTPRIRRSREHLRPMEWVAGDVHHIDIMFQREDGSLCTPKAIAWLDLATNRAFITPVLLDKGKGITRDLVIKSFIDMCADKNWGVPTHPYVDNGGEYNWGETVHDLSMLKVDFQMHFDGPHGMRKSKPYNPQAKVIETAFAGLEKRVF